MLLALACLALSAFAGPPPGAKIGPYDPDPDVLGDEVPAGGWEEAGVIYDASGAMYGCLSGGNDCAGPPAGMQEPEPTPGAQGAAAVAVDTSLASMPVAWQVVSREGDGWRRVERCYMAETILIDRLASTLTVTGGATWNIDRITPVPGGWRLDVRGQIRSGVAEITWIEPGTAATWSLPGQSPKAIAPEEKSRKMEKVEESCG